MPKTGGANLKFSTGSAMMRKEGNQDDQGNRYSNKVEQD
jgi:hypothetical protein